MTKRFKLGDQEFDVVLFDQVRLDEYRNRIKRLAMADDDQPMARFIKKLGGVSAADRASAIAARVQVPGWDDPTPEQMVAVEQSLQGVALLAMFVLSPELPHAEMAPLVEAEGVATLYSRLVRAIQSPTDADIIEGNDKLRAHLKQQRTEAESCQTVSQDETSE